MWLSTKRTILRSLHPGDYPFLYDVAVSGESGWRYRFRGATPSPESFSTHVWDGVLAQYVAVGRDSSEVIGLVSLFGYNFRGRHCSLAALAMPAFQGSGLLIEAAIALIDYGFRTWELHKIYVEALEFNVSQFSRVGDLLVEEGRLVEHEWCEGIWWDLVTYALHRRRWDEIGPRYVSGLAVGLLDAPPTSSPVSAPPGASSGPDLATESAPR